ncbi:MAG: STAS domain-containing protein [Isosphaeraceae bacterium]|nr:STAS domain-containing protein [Isosphaeraceae bacterium]
MPVNVRVVNEVVVLSNFGRLMNDPRHFDASRDVQDLIDRGYRKYVLELRGLGAMGTSGVGLLVTLARLVRKHDGEIVLAAPTPAMERLLEELRLDSFWDVFPGVEEAVASLNTSS